MIESINLSASERRNFKLWQMMRESNSFFNIKELEKLGSKCGIRCVSIKESIKWLLDENMITQNRIASEEYSKLDRKRHELQNILNKELEVLYKEEERYMELVERVNDLSKGDEKTPKKSRKKKVQLEDNINHQDVNDGLIKGKLELSKYKEILYNLEMVNDRGVDVMEREIEFARTAIERWNDNILCVKYWFTKKIINNY